MVELLAGVLNDVVVGVRTISSRSGIGRLDTYGRVTSAVVGV